MTNEFLIPSSEVRFRFCGYAPQGRYRATTVALITQLQAAFPPGVRWSVRADRGFPSAALFAQLRAGGTDCRIRLRLRDWVRVGGVWGDENWLTQPA